MKKIFLFAMGLAMSASTLAQETEKVETTIATDVVSQYIWRGLDCGSVSVQPTLGIGYKGLSLSAWGSVGLSDPADAKVADLGFRTSNKVLSEFHFVDYELSNAE